MMELVGGLGKRRFDHRIEIRRVLYPPALALFDNEGISPRPLARGDAPLDSPAAVTRLVNSSQALYEVCITPQPSPMHRERSALPLAQLPRRAAFRVGELGDAATETFVGAEGGA